MCVLSSSSSPANLIHALCLALDNLPANATNTQIADLVASALQTDAAGKFRKDKDKIAGQLIATAIANNNITDGALIGAITEKVLNVNSGNARAALTLVGKGAALAGALKASSPTAAALIGAELGGTAAGDFGGTPADVGILLSKTAIALGTSAAKSAQSVEAFVTSFLNDEFPTDADRKAQAEAAAVAVAAKIPAAAGSILGGYIGTLGTPTDALLKTTADGYLANKKLAKALGDILAYTMNGHSDKDALFTALSTDRKDKALLAQGLLRAGSPAEAPATIAAFLATTPDRVKTAGIVAAGSGDNEAKLRTIVSAIAAGQEALAAKPAIGAAVITAIGVLNPEAADAAVIAIIETDATAFTSDAARNTLGASIAPRVKSFAAVGWMAAGIAEKNISLNGADPTATALATATALILTKKVNAGTDIAYRTAAISGVTNKLDFAKRLADAAPKFSLNAAVGASLADQSLAGPITKAVINHAPTTDLASIKKAGAIAGAVATAVDEERAAEIAFHVGSLVSLKGAVAGKPVKESTFKTLATALAKAIQAKPNATTLNKMDEAGELAALLTNAIIVAYGGDGQTDARLRAARDKAIIATGSAILKLLSKKSVEESKYLLADQSAAEDIAGSIAYTIHKALPTYRDSILAAGGALEKSFLKLSGKKLTADYEATVNSLKKVRDKEAGFDAVFEDGTLTPSATDPLNQFNDKETDKRNG